MIGSFFFLNFFIGVLFLNYAKASEKEEDFNIAIDDEKSD